MNWHELLNCKPLRREDHLAYWRTQLAYWARLPETWAGQGRPEWFATVEGRVLVCQEQISKLSAREHNAPLS